ncbi:MAG: TetR/AcrR family transcriptional regulator [Alphaproteobacteria bacterium]|nr:MAG: TetR/AcrR family transcriptional regulator [Alphaproteobacteria bacterium]
MSRKTATNVISETSGTREKLVEAASFEFNTVGYSGTNTNQIARRAGFAPQTFYRHFEDKLEIFVAVYEGWQASETRDVAMAAKSRGGSASIARTVLEHHRRWRVFRSSLHMLAVSDDRIRQARAESRKRQIIQVGRLSTNAGRAEADLIADLLVVERIADAAAQGELTDLGVNDKQMLALMTKAVKRLRGE